MLKAQNGSKSPRSNRRAFLRATAAIGVGSWLGKHFRSSAAETDARITSRQLTGSSVGSLYAFIQSQAVKGEFPLSFLNPHFHSVRAWKKRARGKLLESIEARPSSRVPRWWWTKPG